MKNFKKSKIRIHLLNLLLSSTKLVIGILTILFIWASCKDRSDNTDYNPQLPAITQKGANTFGAYINGKIMIPRNSVGYITPGSTHIAVAYSKSSSYENIEAGDYRESGRGYIYIYIGKNNNDELMGSYQFENGNGAIDVSLSQGIMMTCIINGKVYQSLANTGSITIDRNDEIISGTFSCKLRNKEDSNDLIEIREGRFDFNKQTVNTTNFQ